jgi:hypothetical protein
MNDKFNLQLLSLPSPALPFLNACVCIAVGLPPNSMLCEAAKGLAYAISDPRESKRAPPPATPFGGQSPTITTRTPRTNSVGSASSNEGSLDPIFRDGEELLGAPLPYLKVKSHRGKNRMQKFNYAAYNVSQISLSFLPHSRKRCTICTCFCESLPVV